MAPVTSATRTLLVTIILALGSLMVTGLVSYANDASVMNSRIRAIEVQQENDKYRLQRIENKLDALMEYLTGRRVPALP